MTDRRIEPSPDTTDELVMVLGRRAPYTQIGDWVMLSSIRHPAKVLYWALSAHINTERRKGGDTAVWPTQQALAEMLGYSRPDKIRPFLEELVAINAIAIEKEPIPGGGARERSIYTVHQTPPPGWGGLDSIAGFHAARRAATRNGEKLNPGASNGVTAHPETGSRTGASNGVTDRDPKRGPGVTRNGVTNKTNLNTHELKGDEEKEGGGVGGVPHVPLAAPVDNPEEPPSPHCLQHPGGTNDPCWRCGEARKALAEYEADQAELDAAYRRAEQAKEARAAARAAVDACDLCDRHGFRAGELCLHYDPAEQLATIQRGKEKIRAALAEVAERKRQRLDSGAAA